MELTDFPDDLVLLGHLGLLVHLEHLAGTDSQDHREMAESTPLVERERKGRLEELVHLVCPGMMACRV